MSLEAAAGKNPMYNIFAHRLAHVIVAELDGGTEAQCYLVRQIGCFIDDP
jgi:S-adenosylmethionine synthetase